MAKEDVYKELAEMINRDDPHVVGLSVTPLQSAVIQAKQATQSGCLSALGLPRVSGRDLIALAERLA